jgi:hypothetical protein
MIRKIFLFIIILVLPTDLCRSQAFVRTADLFKRPEGSGELNISQNTAIDSLISRYIVSNRKQSRTSEGAQGMDGFRIQVYYGNFRNAREESSKARAEFMNTFPENKFPELISYAQYEEPGYYLVRAGNFRTRIECYKYLIMVRKEFPNAYMVLDKINFPDLINK